MDRLSMNIHSRISCLETLQFDKRAEESKERNGSRKEKEKYTTRIRNVGDEGKTRLIGERIEAWIGKRNTSVRVDRDSSTSLALLSQASFAREWEERREERQGRLPGVRREGGGTRTEVACRRKEQRGESTLITHFCSKRMCMNFKRYLWCVGYVETTKKIALVSPYLTITQLRPCQEKEVHNLPSPFLTYQRCWDLE